MYDDMNRRVYRRRDSSLYEDAEGFGETGPENGSLYGNRRIYKREKKRWPLFAAGVLAGVMVSVVVSGAAMAMGSGSSKSSGPAEQKSGSAISSDTVDKLKLLEEYIDTYYLNSEDLTAEQKADGLYKGLFQSLDDPYSVYYTAEEMEMLQADTAGVYFGIGAYIGTDDVTGAPKITGVIKGSPAEAAQLMENDLIYMVDGEEVTGLSLDEVVRRIRGPEGTSVHLSIYRDGELVEVDLIRAQVNSPTVDSKMLENGIGYLQITEFDDVTVGQFRENMASLQAEGMQALILDLRSNPGGNVSSVTQIAEDLLPEGLVFYMEDKEGHRTEYKCKGADFDLPLAVLVNGNSASASEILAGAIQDAGIGTIVGTQTYGKGVVQNVLPLSDGSGFKLTTAAYYTRGGQNIHKVGITPDVAVEFDSDRYKEDETDSQLEKAQEILTESLQNKN